MTNASIHAWRAGEDPRHVAREVSRAHDHFLATGSTDVRVRPLVVESWQRCLRTGLDPEGAVPPVDLVDAELERWRAGHPLAPVMPVIRRLLIEDAVESGLLVAVSDAAGRLLWVEGQREARRAAERISFVEGAVWSEDRAGTNAPGTALALDQPVQIFAAEHLSRSVTRWSCSAAPIHDPGTGAVIGALDLTGGDQVAAPHTLSLVRATVAAVEGELRLHRLLGLEPHRDPAARPRAKHDGFLLQVLGRPAGLLQRPDGTTRLSLRHSELLTMLAAHPEGLSGERLAAALHDHDHAAVTVRAELSRLRPLLEPVGLSSRPYRLTEPLATDTDRVRDELDRGDVGAAVAAYAGPLLPDSDAPGVGLLRDTLHQDLRAALMVSPDPDPLLRFADTDHGRLDGELWRAALLAMQPHSVRRRQVVEHLAYLDDELGTGQVPGGERATLLQRWGD